jgi:predicted nucleic acid-binding protein
MSRAIIVDTGFLVSLLNRSEQSHNWVKTQLSNISAPLLTCEPVITETCFLLQKIHQGEDTVLSLINRGKIQIPFRIDEESSIIRELMQRYQSVPMSLADACLVRMTEIYPNSILLTLDSDFRIYRKNKKQMIPVIIPDF